MENEQYPGEQHSAFAVLGGRRARVHLTAERFVVTLVGRAEPFRDVPLGRIVSVQDQSGVMTGFLTVILPDEDLAFQRVPKKELVQFAAALRAGVAAAPPEEDLPTPEMAAGRETLEELERLGKLRASGVITAQEFETAKAKMLGRL